MWPWLGIAAVLTPFLFIVVRGAPYVPSKKREIEEAFDELYKVSAKDLLVDIGSGDGVVLRAAARRGAKAVGYELNLFLVIISRVLSRHDVDVRVHMADFWLSELPADTTLVYIFGDARHIAQAAKKTMELQLRVGRPIHLMSYGFVVPGLDPAGRQGAYYLYRFTSSLHPGTA